VKWFRKAAEQGDAEGQNNLGALYAQGQGIQRGLHPRITAASKPRKIRVRRGGRPQGAASVSLGSSSHSMIFAVDTTRFGR
jgi:hypothetical protein